jgi:hypothetical protein
MSSLWRYRLGLLATLAAFGLGMTQAPRLPWWGLVALFVVAAVGLRVSLVAIDELEAATSSSKRRPTSPPA